MLAEDIEVNSRMILLQLQQMDATADTVTNGVEAIKAFREKEYDLIFMDCQMPEMDGYKASQIIRTIEAEPNYLRKRVYIVAMTANAMESDRELCLEAGMDNYIPKPIRKVDLTTFLFNYVSNL